MLLWHCGGFGFWVIVVKIWIVRFFYQKKIKKWKIKNRKVCAELIWSLEVFFLNHSSPGTRGERVSDRRAVGLNPWVESSPLPVCIDLWYFTHGLNRRTGEFKRVMWFFLGGEAKICILNDEDLKKKKKIFLFLLLYGGKQYPRLTTRTEIII